VKKKVKGTLPDYAQNPVLGVLTLPWFISYVENYTTKYPKNINMFCLKNKSFRDVRKKKGEFAALFSQREFVNAIKEACKDVSYIIGELDKDKILLLTKADVTRQLFDTLNAKKGDFACGVTPMGENDNTFSLISRSEVGLNLAQRKRIFYLKV